MRSRQIRSGLLPSAAAAIAVMSALGGCGTKGSATDGPLGKNDSVPLSSNCAPGGRPVAFGFDQFTNHGHTTVVLDRVVLLHPRNERLIGSYAVPGDWLLGEDHWPPENPALPPTWKDRRPVHGFHLAPGKTFNLVLGIAAISSGHRAISQGELIYYHDSSASYVTKNYSAKIIAANARTCA